MIYTSFKHTPIRVGTEKKAARQEAQKIGIFSRSRVRGKFREWQPMKIPNSEGHFPMGSGTALINQKESIY